MEFQRGYHILWVAVAQRMPRAHLVSASSDIQSSERQREVSAAGGRLGAAAAQALC